MSPTNLQCTHLWPTCTCWSPVSRSLMMIIMMIVTLMTLMTMCYLMARDAPMVNTSLAGWPASRAAHSLSAPLKPRRLTWDQHALHCVNYCEPDLGELLGDSHPGPSLLLHHGGRGLAVLHPHAGHVDTMSRVWQWRILGGFSLWQLSDCLWCRWLEVKKLALLTTHGPRAGAIYFMSYIDPTL